MYYFIPNYLQYKLFYVAFYNPVAVFFLLSLQMKEEVAEYDDRNKQATTTALLDKETTVLHEGEKVLVEEETMFYTEIAEQGETVLHKEFTWHNDPNPVQHQALHFGLSFTTQNSPTPTTWYLAPDSSKHRIKISRQLTYPFTQQEPRTVGWTMLQAAITG